MNLQNKEAVSDSFNLVIPSTRLDQPKLLQLHIKGNTVFINNVEVISKRSISRLRIFYILLEQFLCDFKNGLSLEKYKFLNVNQLAEHLKIAPTTNDNIEKKVRRPLNKIQKVIREKLTEESGIKCNDIIESIGWPGFTSKEYGYRLNPIILSFTIKA